MLMTSLDSMLWLESPVAAVSTAVDVPSATWWFQRFWVPGDVDVPAVVGIHAGDGVHAVVNIPSVIGVSISSGVPAIDVP
jgi:hypothetical protein